MSGPSTVRHREDLLRDLNPAQREAVTHAGGPLLVVAGAGTGKTRVLTRRVAWLVSGGLPGRSLLAITFTNKAARVLKERLAGLRGAEDVWAGTFHAFGAWLLRRYGGAIGIDGGFTILDREDQQRLLRDVLRDVPGADEDLRVADVVAAISFVKNGSFGRPPLDLSHPADAARFDAVLAAYRERARVSSLLDFDDLLCEPLRLLRESPEAAEAVHRRIAHVLVDEYQDTNRVQRDLLMEVLGGRPGVTVVGDPDQSIYRWRGASIENILRFADELEGTRTVLLERNYRSSQRILAAAEHVIARNRGRHAKRLFTENPLGTAVRVVASRDGEHETHVIADTLLAWRREGRPYESMAVFYRVNAFTRGLEMALRARAIPYVVVAGVEFFQRREVKDVLAYARLVENPRDDAAFLRVANVPKRGLGDAGLAAIRDAARARGGSLEDASRAGVAALSARARKGLGEFLGVLDVLRALPRAPVSRLLGAAATRSGYLKALEALGDEVGEGRVANVEELVAFARQQEEREPEMDLRTFLERTALVSDQDAVPEDGGRVSLMSVHAAKGLEFPCVVIAGAEDEWFPHVRSAGDEAAEEEERRLFYVAMTRAMENLTITWARRRALYASDAARHPSPFLRDVPEDVVEHESGTLPSWAPAEDETDPYGEDALVRDADAPLAAGERVRHAYFGDGLLVAVHGRGAGARVTVDFEAFGEKTLLLAYARLERLA